MLRITAGNLARGLMVAEQLEAMKETLKEARGVVRLTETAINKG